MITHVNKELTERTSWFLLTEGWYKYYHYSSVPRKRKQHGRGLCGSSVQTGASFSLLAFPYRISLFFPARLELCP